MVAACGVLAELRLWQVGFFVFLLAVLQRIFYRFAVAVFQFGAGGKASSETGYFYFKRL